MGLDDLLDSVPVCCVARVVNDVMLGRWNREIDPLTRLLKDPDPFTSLIGYARLPCDPALGVLRVRDVWAQQYKNGCGIDDLGLKFGGGRFPKALELGSICSQSRPGKDVVEVAQLPSVATTV